MTKRAMLLYRTIIAILLGITIVWYTASFLTVKSTPVKFDGQHALADVQTQVAYSLLDGHTPFLQADIPAPDIIDFDYPYWHTVQDTPDKISAESLSAVGQTLWTWITNKNQQP